MATFLQWCHIVCWMVNAVLLAHHINEKNRYNLSLLCSLIRTKGTMDGFDLPLFPALPRVPSYSHLMVGGCWSSVNWFALWFLTCPDVAFTTLLVWASCVCGGRGESGGCPYCFSKIKPFQQYYSIEQYYILHWDGLSQMYPVFRNSISERKKNSLLMHIGSWVLWASVKNPLNIINGQSIWKTLYLLWQPIITFWKHYWRGGGFWRGQQDSPFVRVEEGTDSLPIFRRGWCTPILSILIIKKN